MNAGVVSLRRRNESSVAAGRREASSLLLISMLASRDNGLIASSYKATLSESIRKEKSLSMVNLLIVIANRRFAIRNPKCDVVPLSLTLWPI